MPPVTAVIRESTRVAEIIPFRPKPKATEDDNELDLLSAVDIAIRDLRDLSRRLRGKASRQQAEDCRQMLERAFNAAV